MIQLFQGSIFDSKCDLIIIPCDNFGYMTLSVEREIMRNNLPYPYQNTEAGNISFVENVGSFSNASAIGYAASVDVINYSSVDLINYSSSIKIIQQIMHRIKNYCQKHSLNKVNVPLLGTGAGGLTAKESYEIMKTEFETISDILLCIYAYSEDKYIELADEKKQIENNQIKNPRVFISYTGTDISNRNWVRDFARKLRMSGVNARLDMFHLKPGHDLPQWMTNEIIMADKVLLICDKYYAEKADSRTGGAGWETMIIQGDMLARQEQNKYAAIVRDNDIDHSIPIYLKSKYALIWTDPEQIDEEEYNKLLLYLFDCDIEEPIGDIPSFIKEKKIKR